MNRSILRGAAVLCLLFCAVATQAQQSSNTATFMYFDNVTKNNWQLAYGIDGYSLSIPNESYLPNGISLSVVNSMFWNWATPDVSSRGLLNPANNVSSATTWYDSTQFSILVDIPGGKVEQFTLYALDWDSQGRSETVQAVDADTNTPLASQTVSNFSNGVYLVWDISGHVRFNITRMAGPNAVISGVFVGGNDNAIHVPADLPTIQSAIDAASPGGTIVVAPGTYQENINFEGKAVTLTSSGGPSVTTIDGGGNATVVTFANGEGPSSVLNGFTVQNGLGSLATAGGIQIANASPTITGNVITKNRAPAALGIYVDGGSPLIENNIITQNNSQVGDAEGGGGILVDAGGASPANPQIIGNTITNNSVALGGIGGGIAVEYFSRAVIQGNLIANNTAYNDGGGIAIQDYDGAVIVQNVIVNNTTIDGVGGGVSVSTPEGVTVIVSDNTVAMNNAAPPENISGIDIGSLAQLYTFTNNIVVAPTGQFAVFCETENGAVLPTLSYTDAYAPGGQAWGGTCNYGSQVGNISVDPLFVNLSISNFHLQPGSPAIDAGSNSAPDLPSTDFDGHSRIFNGTVDLGAYEYQGLTSVSISLPALNFPTQAVGVSSQPLTLTLTNSGSTALQINSIGTTGNFSETDNCQTSKGIAPGQFCQINVVFTPTAGGPQTGQLLVAANLAGSPLSLSLSGIGRTSSTGAAATLAGTDTATQGNWQTQYGSEGYSIAIGAQKLPTYDPSFAVQNQLNWTWAASTTDPRALRIPGGSGGTATTWYSSSSFSLDVNIGDGNSHQVALYLVDWDLGGRSETVQVVDAVSNSPLASTTVSSFTNGVYLLWSISGHVRINISPNSGPNAVVSGVFFGGPPSQAPAPPSLGITKTHSGHVSQGQQGFAYTLTVTNAAGAGTTSGTVTVTESVPSGLSLVSMAGSGWTCPTNTAYCTRNDPLSGGTPYPSITVLVNVGSFASSPQVNQVTASGGGSPSVTASDSTVIVSVNGDGNSASFVTQDATTQGAWQGLYGSEGYALANSAQNLPTYDPTFAVKNQSNWTWDASTSDPRALQVPDSQTNIAAAWYSPQSFSFDVNFNDGQSHDVALYAVDWDTQGRLETIQILDASTNTQLDLETLSNFNSGAYLVWKITGHVTIVVTSKAFPNAVVSGVFFGVPGPPSNQWTWMSGSASLNQNGIYGTLGLTAAANAPGARQLPVTWTDASGNLWMFGGYGYDSVGTLSVLNDIWEYSGSQWTWIGGSNLARQNGVYGARGQTSATNIPGARSDAMSWTDSAGTLWLFGGDGFDSGGNELFLSDLWKYSAGQWTWIAGPSFGGQVGVYGVQGHASPDNNPGARISGLSWTDSAGNFWLFGGLGFDSVGTEGELNDLWEYSAGQWTWIAGSNLANQSATYGTQGIAASVNVPGARFGATGWKDNAGNFWLFGGVGYNATSSSGVLDDLWEYSGGEWTWMGGSPSYNAGGTHGTQGVSSASNVPSSRQYATGWVDASGNFWLFGGNGLGSNGAIGQLNDLWKYSAGQWTWMSGASIANQIGVYGILGKPAAGNTPSGRFSLASWTDTKGNLWLFGGYGAGPTSMGDLSDLWRYQP